MDINTYRKKCGAISVKLAIYGAWWAVNWDANELVKYKGGIYIPYSLRLNYSKGKEVYVAILHDLKTNTEYSKPLGDIEENEEVQLPTELSR